MIIFLWILQVILAIVFVMSGIMKTFQYEKGKEKMAWMKAISKGRANFIGYSELLGAVGLVLPWAIGTLAATMLALTMVFAAIFLIGRKEYVPDVVINLVLFLMLGFVAYTRFMSL